MKAELNIKGMHCKSCEMLISDALEDAGVISSKIDHQTGLAEIEFDKSKLSLDNIKKIIKKEGYKTK